MTIIKNNSYVVLIDTKNKRWLVRVEENKMFSTHHGKINLGDLIGKRFGDIIETHIRRTFYIKKPTIYDFIMKSARKTQIVYPKDIGYIILKLGVRPGMDILEVGTGSGAITTALLWILGDNGLIDTYEKRKDIAETAIKNIDKIPHTDSIIKLYIEDIRRIELDKEKYDAAIIDIDSPWEIIGKIHYSLKSGAGVAFILPTYNQLDKLVEELEKYFIDIEAVELFYRKLQAKKGKIRPEFRMIGYTAIVVTAMKKNIQLYSKS